MPIAFHGVLRLVDDRVLAPTVAERRALARSVISIGREFGLLCARAADTHLRHVVRCDERRANEFSQERHHGTNLDPLHEASTLPDLVGARVGRYLAQAVGQVLPRLRLDDLRAELGLGDDDDAELLAALLDIAPSSARRLRSGTPDPAAVRATQLQLRLRARRRASGEVLDGRAAPADFSALRRVPVPLRNRLQAAPAGRVASRNMHVAPTAVATSTA